MHPIERLRYVARSTGAPQDLLVAETAGALVAFRDDPVGMVTACRRVISRQLTSGPLWWLCSRLLCAIDPLGEARAAVEEIETDETASQLAHLLPDGATVVVVGWPPQVGSALVRRGDVEVLVVDSLREGSSFVHHLQSREVDAVDIDPTRLAAAVSSADAVVIEPSAVSLDAFLSTPGTHAAAAVARSLDVPVWLVTGVGRVLPQPIWQALTSRLDDGGAPWESDHDAVPLGLVDRIVGPGGFERPDDIASRIDCPIANELFKADIT